MSSNIDFYRKTNHERKIKEEEFNKQTEGEEETKVEIEDVKVQETIGNMESIIEEVNSFKQK